MKKLVYNLVVLCVVILFNSGCGGGAAPAAEAPAAEAPATDAPIEASAEQPSASPPPTLQPLFDANGTLGPTTIEEVCPIPPDAARMEAYQRLTEDKLIYWTFHMNFKWITEQKQPVGCFRLFERQNSPKMYVPIVDGAKIVPCEIKPTQEGEDPHVTIGIDQDGIAQAVFDGNGHIECKMNIWEWTANLPIDPNLLAGFLYDEKKQVVNSHKYDNFTVMADVTITKTAATFVPLVHYTPTNGDSSLGLSVNNQEGEISFPTGSCLAPEKEVPDEISFQPDLSKKQTRPIVLADGRQGYTYPNIAVPDKDKIHAQIGYSPDDMKFSVGVRQTFWYDRRTPIPGEERLALKKDDNGSYQPEMLLLSHLQYVQTTDHQSYNKCVVESATSSAALPSLDFSIGEATLYVGYSPTGNTSFVGTIYAIDIDPGDSKPESSAK